MARSVVVFLHAHPDDESIFTGGTMRRLADAGHRVVLVVATGGERGRGDGGPGLDRVRAAETHQAAAMLGIDQVRFLGHGDSGLDPAAATIDAFARVDVEQAAAVLADVLVEVGCDALVTYDAHGVYGHPDHVMAHRVGQRAATLVGTRTVYDVTVDREYLHFVETHLVEQAHRAIDLLAGSVPSDPRTEPPAGLGLAGTPLGVPSVLVDVTVDVRQVLAAKRSAMAAHASQLPPDSPALTLGPDAFAEVYGYEWYCRTGPRGPIDALG